jgi:hypothetical protein
LAPQRRYSRKISAGLSVNMSKPIPERRNRPHRNVNALLHGRRCLLWQQAERRADAYVPKNGKPSTMVQRAAGMCPCRSSNMHLLDPAVYTKSMALSGSIPVIENSTPIFRNGWEAVIRSSPPEWRQFANCRDCRCGLGNRGTPPIACSMPVRFGSVSPSALAMTSEERPVRPCGYRVRQAALSAP